MSDTLTECPEPDTSQTTQRHDNGYLHIVPTLHEWTCPMVHLSQHKFAKVAQYGSVSRYLLQ